jgi:hypothetical protein
VDEADRCEVEESSKQWVETSKGRFKLTQIYFFRNHSALSPLVATLGVFTKKKKTVLLSSSIPSPRSSCRSRAICSLVGTLLDV